MAPSFNLFLMVLLTCALHTNGCYTSIISFGDSLADTGNAKQLAIFENVELHFMFFPYGETYFHNPTGRCSNGRLIVDFVAESLGLPFIPPYVGGDGNAIDFGQGLNYAVASATALEASFHEARGYSVPTNASLRVQLEWFKQSLSSMCATLSATNKTT
ncbi:Lipase, GDSL [Artemisia annua]|uniref:Lipase, GDSL n=1 Tax=Artemisia annua TaxID=35608 RepID=A0A2U1P2A5_ARTAN|nr:Lipase, GDSL [Artemisia annua]